MIVIAGAGPVGSLLAILLKQKGFDVHVYEKRADPRVNSAAAGRSINLVITSRGIHGLRKAGLSHLIDQITKPVYGRMIHSKTGEQIYQAYGQKNECNYSVSRGELNNTLISEAEKIGVKFFFSHSVQSLDTENKKIDFINDNSKLIKSDYEILFGADGSGSQLRKVLIEKFPEATSETQWLEADYKELTLPLSESGEAPLKTDALHIWPRGAHMMMALVNRDNSFTITVYLPKDSSITKSNWGFEKIKTAKDIKKFFESEFSDSVNLMPDYISEFQQNPQGHLGTVRCSKWLFNNSVALIGDAAHAIVPFFGQGMNCGFEDCSALIDLYEKNNGQWSSTLTEYESSRKPNADAIADMALENWVEMRDKVSDPRFLLRKKVESALEQKYPGVFKARYGLITYTLTPYSTAQQAGLLQNEIIEEVIQNIQSIEEVDWNLADKLIQKKWLSFLEKNPLNFNFSF